MCVLQATPHHPLLTFALSVMCECVESWDRLAGSAPSPTSKGWAPLGFGLLMLGDQTSNSVLVACPDAKTLCCCRV